MQKIDLYCSNCKKSMGITYELTGEEETLVLPGATIKCHTKKCTRVVALKKLREKQIIARADCRNRFYL